MPVCGGDEGEREEVVGGKRGGGNGAAFCTTDVPRAPEADNTSRYSEPHMHPTYTAVVAGARTAPPPWRAS